MAYKILVPDAHRRDLDIERAVTGDLMDYMVHDETDPATIPDAEWRSCDAVLIWHRMKLDAGVVSKLDNCKLVVRVGVGFDNVDVAACKKRGITVSNVPNYGTTEVADHAIALMLYLVRGLGSYERRLRADPAAGFVAEDVPVVRRIRGTTFGAIGMGRIGTAVVRRAAAHDMTPIYYDPYLPEGHELGVGVERVGSLEELLSRSDVVSLHTPLDETTKGMVDDDFLAAMKQGAVLINIARGGLVDIDAVERALRSGRLEAVGLDVLPVEPPVPAPALIEAWRNDEGWIAGRFIVTPHAAFYSEAGYVDMRTFSAEILLDRLIHGRIRNDVTQ